MELAVAQGFDVRVVALPPGVDPADDPAAFEAQLRSARPYVVHRTQLEATRADDRAGRRARGRRRSSTRSPTSLEKDEAWRWANDYFGTTLQLRASAGGTASAAAAISPKVLAVGDRLERDALAGVVALPGAEAAARGGQAGALPRRDAPRVCARTSSTATPLDDDGVALLAELDARAEREGIDENVGTELLLALGERALQEDLQHADFARTRQIQEQILRLREALTAVRRRTARSYPRDLGDRAAGRARPFARRSRATRTARPLARRPAPPISARARRIGQQRVHALGDAVDEAVGSSGSPEPSSRVANGTSRPVTPSSTTSGMPPVARRHDGRLAGHRLEVHDPQRLVDRRADEHGRVAQQLDDLVLARASGRARSRCRARPRSASTVPPPRRASSGVSGAPAQRTSCAAGSMSSARLEQVAARPSAA